MCPITLHKRLTSEERDAAKAPLRSAVRPYFCGYYSTPAQINASRKRRFVMSPRLEPQGSTSVRQIREIEKELQALRDKTEHLERRNRDLHMEITKLQEQIPHAVLKARGQNPRYTLRSTKGHAWSDRPGAQVPLVLKTLVQQSPELKAYLEKKAYEYAELRSAHCKLLQSLRNSRGCSQGRFRPMHGELQFSNPKTVSKCKQSSRSLQYHNVPNCWPSTPMGEIARTEGAAQASFPEEDLMGNGFAYRHRTTFGGQTLDIGEKLVRSTYGSIGNTSTPSCVFQGNERLSSKPITAANSFSENVVKLDVQSTNCQVERGRGISPGSVGPSGDETSPSAEMHTFSMDRRCSPLLSVPRHVQDSRNTKPTLIDLLEGNGNRFQQADADPLAKVESLESQAMQDENLTAGTNRRSRLVSYEAVKHGAIDPPLRAQKRSANYGGAGSPKRRCRPRPDTMACHFGGWDARKATRFPLVPRKYASSSKALHASISNDEESASRPQQDTIAIPVVVQDENADTPSPWRASRNNLGTRASTVSGTQAAKITVKAGGEPLDILRSNVIDLNDQKQTHSLRINLAYPRSADFKIATNSISFEWRPLLPRESRHASIDMPGAALQRTQAFGVCVSIASQGGRYDYLEDGSADTVLLPQQSKLKSAREDDGAAGQCWARSTFCRATKRSRETRAKSPPGFWRTDMGSTQELWHERFHV